MRKIIASIMIAVCAVCGVCATAMPTFAADTQSVLCPDGTVSSNGSLEGCNGTITAQNNNNNLMQTLNTVINVIVGVVGFIAVVMIVIGGIQYAVSAGEPAKTKKAKDTIMYGIIGLVVSLLAFAIVNFVLTSVFK